MGKVYINYLKNGCVTADAPVDFGSMTDKQKMEWAQNALNEKNDKDLIKGLSDFENPKKSGFFDETPEPLAIEDEYSNTYVSTNVWDSYNQPVVLSTEEAING